jgi:hypothetical protein
MIITVTFITFIDNVQNCDSYVNILLSETYKWKINDISSADEK